MKIAVTGGAGFIGSNLVEALLERGHEVLILDDMSTGHEFFIENSLKHAKCKFIKCDLGDLNHLISSLKGIESVFHLAANADVRFGPDQRFKDFEKNSRNTLHVLEAMLENGIKDICFSSTGSVYGETEVFPTPENAPFPLQTSLYGSSKLYGENLLSSYSHAFGIRACVFRFVSILGERYTHGHVWDFYFKLRQNPESLNVLGNGEQRKSYLYIQDCISGFLMAWEKHPNLFDVYNLGQDNYISVKQSISWILDELKLNPKINFSSNEPRGWIGDNSFILLDINKIQSLGWKPQVNIEEALRRTLRYIRENEAQLKRSDL